METVLAVAVLVSSVLELYREWRDATGRAIA